MGRENVLRRKAGAVIMGTALVVLTLLRSRVGEKPVLSPYMAGELYSYSCWATPVMALAAVVALFLSAVI